MRPAAATVGVLAVAVAVFAVLPRGPALSGDSAVYLSVAESLARGHGFVQFDGAPYARWAPLLPVILAPFTSLGLDAAWAGFALNLLASFAVLALAATWLARRVAEPIVRALALVVFVSSATLLEATVFVWSDLPFLALALLALLGADRLESADHARRRRLALQGGAVVALAILVRYAGLALVPVGVVLLLARAPGAPGGRRRLVDAAGFAGVALLPIAAWCARNLAVTGGAFGPRRPATMELAAQAQDLAAALGVWIVGSGQAEGTRVLAGVALVAVAIIAVVAGHVGRARRRAPEHVPPSVWACAGFVSTSILVLVGWSSYASIERINERYTIPLVVPAVLVVAWAIGGARTRASRRGTARLGLVVGGGLALAMIGLGTVRTARHVERYRGPGEWGFNTERWDRSERDGFLADIARIPPEVALFSNAPEAVYARLRRRASGFVVPKDGMPEHSLIVEFADVPGTDPQAFEEFVRTVGRPYGSQSFSSWDGRAMARTRPWQL